MFEYLIKKSFIHYILLALLGGYDENKFKNLKAGEEMNEEIILHDEIINELGGHHIFLYAQPKNATFRESCLNI